MATAIEGNNNVNKKNIGGSIHPGYSLNPGQKPNEDRIKVLSSKDKYITILAVFDGHGNDKVSEYLKNNLPQKILEEVIKLAPYYDPHKITEILSSEFISINKGIKDLYGGSTGTVCVVTPKCVITANVGDSPAILFTKEGKIIGTTTDHDFNNTLEVERIMKAGNSVITCINGIKRLKSGLAMTRSFGDRMHPGVIAEPYTYIWDKNLSESLILAVFSDSFTEELRETPRRHIGPYCTRNDMMGELIQSINKTKSLQRASKRAVNKRINKFKIDNRYCGDNTSLILMEINTPIFENVAIELQEDIHQIESTIKKCNIEEFSQFIQRPPICQIETLCHVIQQPSVRQTTPFQCSRLRAPFWPTETPYKVESPFQFSLQRHIWQVTPFQVSQRPICQAETLCQLSDPFLIAEKNIQLSLQRVLLFSSPELNTSTNNLTNCVRVYEIKPSTSLYDMKLKESFIFGG